MVVETIFAGRNNTFSLQLLRDGSAINLLSITGYELNLSNGRTFAENSTDGLTRFIEKEDGIVEINIGDALTAADVGNHNAHLITFDPVNTAGVRWPNFKLKVKA